jgi:hypothetical protein
MVLHMNEVGDRFCCSNQCEEEYMSPYSTLSDASDASDDLLEEELSKDWDW